MKVEMNNYSREEKLKIKALDVKAGDRIVAYCKNKRQICKVKQILDLSQTNVTLSVFTTEHYRGCLVSCVVRFQWDALVELVS
ncbi:hypothetical protein [Calothrix sp. NIES-2100]|uniref:hypothetical protein n=1 Tax=Calothrix sp. NIES-2100 TaxID=1954172 RepID=UPI0030D83577